MTRNNQTESQTDPATPTLDWDEALERVAGDAQTLNELVEIFLEQWPEVMDEIEQSVARKDQTTLRRAAHTLKGSALIFGAKPVASAADALSEMARQNQLQNAEDALRQLQDRMESLVPALEAGPNQ